MGERRYSSHIVNLDCGSRRLVSYTFWPLCCRGKTPGTYFLGGWEGPKTVLGFRCGKVVSHWEVTYISEIVNLGNRWKWLVSFTFKQLWSRSLRLGEPQSWFRFQTYVVKRSWVTERSCASRWSHYTYECCIEGHISLLSTGWRRIGYYKPSKGEWLSHDQKYIWCHLGFKPSYRSVLNLLYSDHGMILIPLNRGVTSHMSTIVL
jgi:hypothetical protein